MCCSLQPVRPPCRINCVRAKILSVHSLLQTRPSVLILHHNTWMLLCCLSKQRLIGERDSSARRETLKQQLCLSAINECEQCNKRSQKLISLKICVYVLHITNF